MTGGVCCVGGIVVDLLATPVMRMPAPGRLELVDRMQLSTGGCASNAASGLVRLGVPARLVGAIGADDLGDYVIGNLTERGVNLEALIRKPEASTSASMVLVQPDGERAFIHTWGAGGLLHDSDIQWERIADSRIFFVTQALLLPSFDGEPTARALRHARSLGMITALDTVWDATGAWMQTIRPCLPHLDYFLPSEAEAQHLSGCERPEEMAACFLERGVNVVGIKLGDQGCYLQAAGEPGFYVKPFRVEAVDATGAGDAWCAGFLAAVYHGASLERAGRFANAAGACCVTSLGATAGVRGWNETVAFIAAQGGEF